MKMHGGFLRLTFGLAAIVALGLGCNLIGGLPAAAVATPPRTATARPPTATPSLQPTETPTRTPSPQPPTATPIATATTTPTMPATATPTWTPSPQPPTAVSTVLPTAAPVSPSKEKAPAFIVFASDAPGDTTGRAGIYRVNLDGTGLTELRPFSRQGDWDVAVSPDGQRMLYSGGDGDIHLINAGSSDPVNLTNTRDPQEYWPLWSPDGRRIAYERYSYSDNTTRRINQDADIADIYIMNAEGSNPVNLTNNQPGYSSGAQAWSPDGQRIAFVAWSSGGQQDIYVMNADGTNRVNLTNTPDSNEIKPAWLSNGERIAYYCQYMGDGDGTDGLFTMNADGTAPVRLTFAVPERYSVSQFSGFTWSPDGQRLAFLAEYTDPNPGIDLKPSTPGLFVASADGSNATRLTDLTLSVKGRFSWSPDGRQLAFAAGPADKLSGYDDHALYVINADGTGLERLTEAGFANIDNVEWVSP